MLDKKVPNSLVGIEYDAGCWIGRVVSNGYPWAARPTPASCSSWSWWACLAALVPTASRLERNVPGYRLLRRPNSLLCLPGLAALTFTDD